MMAESRRLQEFRQFFFFSVDFPRIKVNDFKDSAVSLLADGNGKASELPVNGSVA